MPLIITLFESWPLKKILSPHYCTSVPIPILNSFPVCTTGCLWFLHFSQNVPSKQRFALTTSQIPGPYCDSDIEKSAGKSRSPTNLRRLWRFLSSKETKSSLFSIKYTPKLLTCAKTRLSMEKPVQMSDFINNDSVITVRMWVNTAFY